MVAQTVSQRDILVRDGRIAHLAEPGAGAARETIDATGLLALPGVVDAHVHVDDPGRESWEGWEHGSSGAAAGGVTTVADMPLNSLPPTLDGASFDLKRSAGERTSVVDFALWGGLVAADAAPLRELAGRGAVGVKAFLCDSGVPEFPRLADGQFVDAMRAAASVGLLVAVHAEDDAVVREATARVLALGRRDGAAWTASRPAVAEARAIARACEAAREAGARLHVVHCSSAEALGAIGVARDGGLDVSVETCPHYLLFDENDVLREGTLLKCAPPIRDKPNAERLWAALLGGRIDLVASDHSPCAADRKRGDDVFAAWGGISGVQSLLPVVFTEARRRAGERLDLARVAGFVAWRLATRPAQRLGIWPRKGAIAAGSDADIVLMDAEREWTLESSAVRARSGLSPYAGHRFRGAIARTLVRGRTVYRDGDIVAEPGWGRFVARSEAPTLGRRTRRVHQ